MHAGQENRRPGTPTSSCSDSAPRLRHLVLPFDSGAHAAAGVGSLAILQFPEAPELGVVHLGGASGGVCLEAQADIAAYTRLFEQLRALALSPAQSALLLRGLAGA